MSDSSSKWKYVVFAQGQQWLVDLMVESGKVPLSVEQVETQYCPRGTVYLLPDPEEYLSTLKIYDSSLAPQEFHEMWHERELQRLIRESVLSHPTPKSFVQIESIP